MDYKPFALNLAKQAGGIMRANFILGMDRELKGDGTPVTKTDLAINSLVIEEVKNHYPEHAVVGEEENNAKADAEFAWICDPVDGTIPFSHGMPTCAFSLALTQNGEPILGVAFDPFLDRMMVAEKGKGTTLNGEKVKVSKTNSLKGAYISHCIWPKMQYPMDGLIDDMVFKKEAQSFGIGSIVYNAMLLAAGEIDAITFGHTTAHDVAAIKIFVEEAGGKVTDLWGESQRYDREIKGAIISNGLIHELMLRLVKEHLRP